MTGVRAAQAGQNRQAAVPKAIERSCRVILLSVLGLGLSPSAAYPVEPVSDDWQVTVTPYLWALSVEGDQTIQGKESELDLGFDDILEHLNFGVFGQVDARKGRFGLLLNGYFANLEGDAEAGPLDIDADVNLALSEFGGYYRLGPYDVGDHGAKLVVDPFLAGRYTYVDIDLDIDAGGPQGRTMTDSGSEGWIDPVIGVRATLFINKRWNIAALGDYGGFGLSGDQDTSYTFATTVGYRFSALGGENNAEFRGGYRILVQDYKNGSGDSEFAWDMTTQGPLVGLAFSF